MMKGLIFFENSEVETRPGVISSHRPVVIVSESAEAGVVQVVPLTSSENKRKENVPYHVQIDSCGKPSVALCEQIRSVPLTELARMPKWICTQEETTAIETALLGLLGFDVM